MDAARYKELQLRFLALRNEWMVAESAAERLALLDQISTVLKECKELVKQSHLETIRRTTPRATKTGSYSHGPCFG